MPKIKVVTLMWGTAWDRYGQDFLRTFDQYWPDEIELILVTDKIRDIKHKQILLGDQKSYSIFLSKYGDDPIAQGKQTNEKKLDADGVSWKHNALKWMPQGIAPMAAIGEFMDGDILVWMDADVITTKKVPPQWVSELLDDNDVALLQRKPKHSEIGFYAMRVGAKTRQILTLFELLYVGGGVFDLDEFHSAFVLDFCIECAETAFENPSHIPPLKIKNLNTRNARGHVWPGSPLAEYTDHRKGKRKPQ